MNLQAMRHSFPKNEIKISSLWLTAADRSIFLYSITFITVPSTLHIFSQIILVKRLSSILRKSHRTGRCSSSQILNKQTIFYQLASSLLRMMMNLVLKGTKCGTILTDALAYERLKREATDNSNNLRCRFRAGICGCAQCRSVECKCYMM